MGVTTKEFWPLHLIKILLCILIYMLGPSFKDVYDISIRNDLTTQKKCAFNLARPDILRTNLNDKSIRIQKFYLNNTYLAQFIPDRVSSSSYFTIDPGATTNNFINNSLTVNSLAYYITLRKTDNSVSYTIFIRHIPESPVLPVPPVPIVSDTQYYMNQYYWYHDFVDFLQIIQDAIVQLAGAAGLLPNPMPVSFNLINNAFSLLVGQDLFSPGYQLEFSQNLQVLFPFKSEYNTVFPSTVILNPASLPVTSGSTTYLVFNCVIYDTVFPWSEILITSERMGLNPTKFLGDIELKNNIQNPIYTNTILAFNIQTSNFLVYNYYEYTNNFESEYINFYLNECQNDTFDLSVNLRLKNNIVIPMFLNYKELFKMTLEILYKP